MHNNGDTNLFDVWNQKKKEIDGQSPGIYYREGEVWWCSLGKNIGSEENGKNDQFERPVLILRKFSKDLTCIIPLTTNIKVGVFYVEITSLKVKQCAMVSHMRSISTKRLLRKVGLVSYEDYQRVLTTTTEVLLKTKPPPVGGGISEPDGHCEVIISPEEQL